MPPGAALLETSVPGVFAVGDVRSGSVKRCATAVGEGAMVVRFVHERMPASRPSLTTVPLDPGSAEVDRLRSSVCTRLRQTARELRA